MSDTTIAPKLKPYKGTITNTDRWQKFQHKPGDVFVCTPPKCGTTWTTTIVTMLAQGSTDVAPQELVQWVDADVIPLNQTLAALARQNHASCIKTHTPFDGIPWYSDASYIAVYRHPIDMLFSLRKHLDNAKDTPHDHPYLGAADDALAAFVARAIDPEDFDFDCLESVVHHYCSFRRIPQPENLLRLHYRDMLADSRVAIGRIAAHMDLTPDASLIDAIHDATSFEAMQSQANRFVPFSDLGYWHDPKVFFDSAGTQKWVGKVSDASLRVYRNKVDQFLSPEERAWIEDGDASRVDLQNAGL